MMVALRIRPAIVLFGDSITQQGFGVEGKIGWASLLASDYSRRAGKHRRMRRERRSFWFLIIL